MKKRTIKSKWIDPDEAPTLERDWFERAEIWEGNKLIRPGRPRKAAPKEAVSLRLDPDVLEHFRASGPGWQSRINAALRKVARLRS
ncbi:MAG: BrnA antitoxin family protein [Xanthobacteraceae bacterium]|jgi:uncharacterized protein (DUF4415 family)